MHKLLERQLRRNFGPDFVPPPGWSAFLAAVDATYTGADEDRALLERSMEISSQELVERNGELRASETRYRRIVETATEGIWLIGPDARTSFANARMAEMLGCTVDDLRWSSPLDFVAVADVPLAEEALGALRAGRREHVDLRLVRKDGSDLWVAVSATPIVDENGFQGALGMFTDVTDRKRAESELKTAYERLKDVDRFRTQFINNAAHELGTPLTPIKIQIHLLRRALDGAGNVEEARKLVVLERNLDRLADLARDILDAARLQASKLQLDREPVDVAQTVAEALEAFADVADDAGVELKATVEMPCRVVGDPRRLSQVLYNLLSNALKFTPRGGVVSVEARAVGSDLVVRVHDTGAGLAAGDAERLFQPFVQVHESSRSPHRGTGLGLYISKGIVETSGGRIWCESPGPGKGSTFAFALPLAAPPPVTH